jgi:hypothetical protein
MSVTWAHEVSKTGERSSLTGTSVRQYEVLCSSATDREQTILDSGNLPSIGDSLPGNAALTLKRYSFSQRQADARKLWDVSCYYDNRPDEYEDPTANPPDIRYGFVQYSVATGWSYAYNTGTGLITDTFDNPTAPIVNAANQFFDPAPEIPLSRLQIQISRNERYFNPLWAYTFNDSVNQSAVTIAGVTYAARCIRMVGIEAAKLWDNAKVPYYSVTYTMQAQHYTYDLRLVNRGLMQVTTDSADNDWEWVEDANGKEITTEVNLDANGRAQGPNDTPIQLVFRIHWETNWGFLNLPQSP